MLLEEDDLRNRLSGVGRPLDARETHHAFYQTRRREDPRMSPAAGELAEAPPLLLLICRTVDWSEERLTAYTVASDHTRCTDSSG